MWTLFGQITPLALTFITTPILLRLAGAENYGVIALLNVLPQYLYFTDLGMVMASTKFGSEYFSRGDIEGEGRVIRSAALFSLILSVPAATLMVIFSREIAIFFSVPGHLLDDGSIAVKLAAANLVVYLLGSIFNSPQLARLRMDLNSVTIIVTRLIAQIGLPLAFYFGYGIVGAAVVTLVGGVVNLVAQFLISYSMLPTLAGTSVERSAAKPMLHFGSLMAVTGIASMAIAHLEKGGLSALSSVEELGYYSVAFSLALLTVVLSSSMMQSLIPAFSQLQGDEKRAERNILFGRSMKLMLIWIAPVIGILGIGAETFLTVWAGPDFGARSTLPFYLLLVGLPFNLVTYTPTSMLIATGRTDITARIFWFELPIYAALLYVLIPRYGAAGAAGAWSIRVAGDCLIQMWVAKRVAHVQLPWPQLFVYLAAAAIMLLPFVLHVLLGLNFIIAGVAALPCLAVYTWIIWNRFLDSAESGWIKGLVASRLPGVGR